MVQRKFICESTKIHELEIENRFKNLITISIYDRVNEMLLALELNINDAEQLMDELHKVISKIEGGK
jgi:hypothetical protein